MLFGFVVFLVSPTVTGIVGVGVAILVTVVAVGPSDPLGVSNWSTVTGIVGVGVAILVTVIAFGPSDPLEVSSVPTVTVGLGSRSW